MKEEGFSLIELLMVVAILGIISAIAVPNLLNAKKASYEASAVRYLKSWVAGQELYKRANGNYAYADDDLVIGKFIERAIIADGTADDTAYIYSIDSSPATPAEQWFGRARRRSPLIATNSYYIDQSGVIRGAAANTANVTDPPTQ
ncbi:MAG: type II secretion system GspH family protein [Blastocatellia bacterium]|nr:type II secretion system GspH family protein [Blastocatellia bacterium]